MALKKAVRAAQMDREAILAAVPAATEATRSEADQPAEAPVVDLRLAGPGSSRKSPPGRRARPAEQEEPTRGSGTTSPGSGNAITLLLTEDQWEWVRREAERRKVAQRYVLLAAIERHHDAVAEHFRITVDEGGGTLFRWRGEPKDVDGRKVGSPVRIPDVERAILQRLVDEASAPSLSFYLRVAASLAMQAE